LPYEWVDHTSELELQIEAAEEADVFREALAALGELLGEAPGGEPAHHRVSVGAPDRGTLLAEWLSELAFLAETEGFVPERVERLQLTEDALDATVAGRRGIPPPLVKAVTYHRLGMWRDGEIWRARVVLDV
jgi:SHS2 domain-containing protein